MPTDVAPHEFTPYRWYDVLHRNGRCGACLLPKWSHPVHCWMTARGLLHSKYYKWDVVIAHKLAADHNRQNSA